MKKVIVGVNDLATTHPDIAKEWHPTFNGDLKPTDVTAGSKKDVWWLYPYDDPETGLHWDFPFRAKISNRRNGDGCPVLSGHVVWPGFNDLATTHPNVAKEWHPTKNGKLKPTDVLAGCNEKVWWLCEYNDSRTNEVLTHEWRAEISKRALRNQGCSLIKASKLERLTYRGIINLMMSWEDTIKHLRRQAYQLIGEDKIE